MLSLRNLNPLSRKKNDKNKTKHDGVICLLVNCHWYVITQLTYSKIYILSYTMKNM